MLPLVNPTLRRDLLEFVDHLTKHIEDPRCPWGRYHKNTKATLDRLLSAAAGEADGNELDDLVTLDQAAAMVHRSKRSLQRHVHKGDLPKADIKGGFGKASRWYWSNLRPSLEKLFVPDLPKKFPYSRFESS